MINMHNNKYAYSCRVCGFIYEDKPWGEDGKCPSFQICVCCGAEFGYEDFSHNSILAFRENWIKSGSKFIKPEFMPKNWNLKKQMENIPPEFR
jgi:hypothetical protein